MKNKIYIILISIFALWSCNDYEEVPVEYYTLPYVFSPTDSIGTDAKRYLNNVYSILTKDNGGSGYNKLGGGTDTDFLDAASDDAISSSLTESPAYKLQTAGYSASIRISGEMGWGNWYKGIRWANTFINNIDVVPFREKYSNHVGIGMPLNRVLKAEARFLRAFYYFELVKRYGGVPLMGNIPYELGEDIELPRGTFEDCIEYIVSEIDAVKDSLRSAPIPNVATYGHAPTVGSALALKARVLLYAASPLFNGNSIEEDNPYIGYTDISADKVADRWKKAADAADYLMKEWGPDGRNVYALVDDFRRAFLDYNNSETLFHTQNNPNFDVERANGPVGFTQNAAGNGCTSPTQNLVDAFPMLDGKPRGESKYAYDMRTMYDNRDPRLKYTVIHNGSRWLSTTIQTYTGGRHNPSGVSMQKTKTTYYLRKFMGLFEDQNVYSNIYRNWISFRYAEVLLNYAEAKNEHDLATGKATVDASVLDAIRALRKRAGIEEGGGTYGIENNTTCEDMREIIRNERRIELAFEEHRFYDIRRWRIAEDIFKEPLKGLMLIMRAGNIEPPVVIDVQKAKFEKHQYLYPLPYGEVNKNVNMEQNPGWK